MATTRQTFYQDRARHFSTESQKRNRQANYISIIRILIFTLFLVVVVLAANNRNLLLLSMSTIAFFILFGLLVNFHERIKYATKQFAFLSRINDEELSRLQGNLEHFDGGNYFMDEHHPYHVDLDIFGKNSLFQLLNRTTTFQGRKVLASWISEPAMRDVIHARQDAIRELAEDIDWIQEFEATGRHSDVHADTGKFFKWLESPPLLLGKPFYSVIRFAGPVMAISLLILFIFFDLSLIWLLAGLAFNALILFLIQDDIRMVHESTSSSIKSLQSFESLILMIESKEFSSPLLRETVSVFKPEGTPASRIIRRLRKILLQLDNRSNMIYHLFNVFLLFDLHYTIAAENWKRDQPEDIRNWFLKLGEMEALNSLAGYHFANPAYKFPQISGSDFVFTAKNAGHPLIAGHKRVNNDFSFEGKGTIVLITGSNMSGKSTFLRTTGINAVLALAGAPVCADEFIISTFRIFTGMRTQDNLEENISSFYAELKRIRQLLDYIPGRIPVLFLLDEILKGTNSNDRHLGAVSLVYQLSAEKAAGLISTHDLDLARQTMKNPMIVNYSFESNMRGEEIFFDYKLRPGICETFNASRLMEKMGIRLID